MDTPIALSNLQENNDLAIYLVKNGAEVEIKNNDGLTPLELATQVGNQLVVEAINQSYKSFKATPKSGASSRPLNTNVKLLFILSKLNDR